MEATIPGGSAFRDGDSVVIYSLGVAVLIEFGGLMLGSCLSKSTRFQ